MQFIPNGPDIPETLLHAHEEGSVAFFCGSGISVPAGLPLFKGLVEKIYQKCETSWDFNEREKYAFEREQYDLTLDLLERRLPNGNTVMRSVIPSILKPNLRRKGALETHKAILDLARNRVGKLRLVTTNFDRIFDYVIKKEKLSVNHYVAPMLPLAKNSHWDGLVYLHGCLSGSKLESEIDKSLQHLVLTSGDFGLAYLAERWAARFVSDLFRNYTVCFVGYSVNDPVLRYMMDALAADRRLGESVPSAYAFSDFNPDQEKEKQLNEWKAKGVEPILYNASDNDHSILCQTLKEWAEVYRDGILGKEQVVRACAMSSPSTSTNEDNFVGRMLWALTDQSGKPARCFAEHNPVPPLEWLDEFSKKTYRRNDLKYFGVTSQQNGDEKLEFSLICRPGHHPYTPWMPLVSIGGSHCPLDPIMWQLGRWLIRHLNDPNLLIWISQNGGLLSSEWAWMIDNRLCELLKFENEKKHKDLDDIRKNAPNAIPSPAIRKLWAILLSGRAHIPPSNTNSIYKWMDSIECEGLTIPLRLKLREILAPKVEFAEPYFWPDFNNNEKSIPDRLDRLVRCELTLSTNHIHSIIQMHDHKEWWKNALPLLLDEFQRLLLDAMDLSLEIEQTDEHYDLSHLYMPSICPHLQNNDYRAWTILIVLLRDSWLAILDTDTKKATQIALEWFDIPYPIFKRLAFFAASQNNVISPDQWVEWFTVDNSWWLWSVVTQREVMRLLVLQGSKLTAKTQKTLEAMILQGPPRKMFRDGIEQDDWSYLQVWNIWLRLAKLTVADVVLNKKAMKFFENISKENSSWKLAKNERDEFSSWTSGTGDPDYEEQQQVDTAPHKRKDLVDWLKKHISKSDRRDRDYPFYADTWRNVCQKHLLNSGYALLDLSSKYSELINRWNETFNTWSEGKLPKHSWRYFALSIRDMPIEFLNKTIHSITRWLREVACSLDKHEDIFLDICGKILDLPLEDGMITDDPIRQAINHPAGKIAEAILNLLFRQEQKDNNLLSEKYREIFTWMCDSNEDRFRCGRVTLASHAISLFRIDQQWCEDNLLPLFDWENTVEAQAAWAGFLRHPRIFWPLMIAFKSFFLETSSHYQELRYGQERFAQFLTYVALAPVGEYSTQEIRDAICQLPQEGLEVIVRTLVEAYKGAGEQRENYWGNRICPFWKNYWPKHEKYRSKSISESLVQLCIAVNTRFPEALSKFKDWLLPIETWRVTFDILNSDLCEKFSKDVLSLLDAVIDVNFYNDDQLRKCLDKISQSEKSLLHDKRYKRLLKLTK